MKRAEQLPGLTGECKVKAAVTEVNSKKHFLLLLYEI